MAAMETTYAQFWRGPRIQCNPRMAIRNIASANELGC
jgi:hypothetical protein